MTNVFRLGQSPGAVVFMAMHDSGEKIFMLFSFPYESHCHDCGAMELYAAHTPIAKNLIFLFSTLIWEGNNWVMEDIFEG